VSGTAAAALVDNQNNPGGCGFTQPTCIACMHAQQLPVPVNGTAVAAALEKAPTDMLDQ
jgi:hypothetical protein